MALRIWLPLNGSLKNYGISGLTFSNVSSTNTTVSSSGKIGSCYANNSSSAGGLVSNEKIELGIKQSAFCWIKFTSFNTDSNLNGVLGQHEYQANAGLGLTVKTLSSTTGCVSVNTGDGTNRTFNTYCGSTVLFTNTWYHLGYTYDGSQIKLYVNGKLDGTHNYSGMLCPSNYFQIFAWSITSNKVLYGGYKTNGSINDVRAYDHCLSDKEVKEISKGLFFHLPLSDTFVASSTKSFDCSGYNHAVTNTGAFECSTDTKRNQYSTVFGGSSYMTTESMYIPDSLTISMWLKRTNHGHVLDWRNGSEAGVQPIYINNSGQIQYWSSAVSDSEYFSKVINTDTWYHICLVANTSTVKLYVDGTLIGSKTNGKTAISAPLKIGARCSNVNIINAKICDLRLYATELSADDIAQLYKIPAFIDNHGNFYCHEFEAYVESDNFDIGKTGFARFFEFREEDNLENSQIYEI